MHRYIYLYINSYIYMLYIYIYINICIIFTYTCVCVPREKIAFNTIKYNDITMIMIRKTIITTV